MKDKKVRLIRYAVLARNRVNAIKNKPGISTREHIESNKVSELYKNWIIKHKLK